MKIFFAILGIVIIVLQTLALGQSYRGLDSPLWGYLLGIGLIAAPFTALGMLVTYLLLLAAFFGPAIGGFILVKEITGLSSLGIIGAFAGAAVGIKFVGSGLFDRLLEPLRRLANEEEDEKE